MEIQLKTITDARGSLTVAETGKQLPFAVQRVYFITGTKGDAPRGFHAHKALHQVFVCVAGSCTLILDDGKTKTTHKMDSPSKAFHVGPLLWHEMHDFSAGCVFLALASAPYDESDYIRDYDAFRKAVA